MRKEDLEGSFLICTRCDDKFLDFKEGIIYKIEYDGGELTIADKQILPCADEFNIDELRLGLKNVYDGKVDFDYVHHVEKEIKNSTNIITARETYTQYQNLLLATLQSNPLSSMYNVICQIGRISDSICDTVIDNLNWDKENDFDYVLSSLEGSIDFDAMFENRQIEPDTKIYNRGE